MLPRCAFDGSAGAGLAERLTQLSQRNALLAGTAGGGLLAVFVRDGLFEVGGKCLHGGADVLAQIEDGIFHVFAQFLSDLKACRRDQTAAGDGFALLEGRADGGLVRLHHHLDLAVIAGQLLHGRRVHLYTL